MYEKHLIALLDEAKKLHKNGIPIELEVRFGRIENSEFKSGFSAGRFRMMRDWMDQSNFVHSNWCESVSTFVGKHERCIVTKSANLKVTNIEKVEKRPICEVILKSNHPEGICIKVCLYTEKPITSKTATTITMVRLRQRKSYALNSVGFDKSFSLDFTLVWQGASERAVKEMQRSGNFTRYEMELELTNLDYLANKSSNYLLDSIIGKCKSLFQNEMAVNKTIEFSL